MNLPGFSVRRPIFTTMVVLIIITIGSVSLDRLRIDYLPTIELPTLDIRTNYEGASPEVMERLVTQILEEIVATVPGVEEMSSQSSEGRSSISVRFVWNTDIDTAALDVTSKIEDEINELPDNIVRPRIRKFDIGSFPVVLLGISSDLDPVELTQLIENQIRYRFARIPGVAQVDVWGGFDREVRIELDPDRIKALGLPFDKVIKAIRDANLELPAGKIEMGRFEVTLSLPSEFVDMNQIRDTIISNQDGTLIRLSQIAEVKDTYTKLRRIIRVNGRRGIRVAIRKQANANTVEVSRQILSEIESANKAFPRIRIVPVINQGNFIERSIANVTKSVLYGGGLAIVVLLFFLRSITSTLIISLSIPISLVATFALIYFGGFTLNLMSLGGLALGVGMMVDSSIVVLENIYRRKNEYNEHPVEGSVKGAMEVSSAIVASTLTTLVIFLPLVFVRGVSGILFQELAYVVMFSLVCSLLIALSLVPMLSARFMTTQNRNKDFESTIVGRLSKGSDRLYQKFSNQYRDFLLGVLNHRFIAVLTAVAALAGSLLLVPYIGTEFIPPSDEGEIRVTGEMELGTRLDLIDRQSRIMERIVSDSVPEAVSSVVSVGASGRRPNAMSRSQINLSLTPSMERQRSNTQIAIDLRKSLDGKIPAMKIRTRAPQGQFLLERILGGNDGLTIEVIGFELFILEALARKVSEAINDIPGITDVETDKLDGIPRQEVRIDRDKIGDLGLSVSDVAKAIETAVAGSNAGEFRVDGNSYRIFVQLKDAEKRSIDEILDLTLTTASGNLVPLKSFVTTQPGIGPILIDRRNQQRQVRVVANIAGRDMGSVATEAQMRLDQIPRPVGYDLRVSGAWEEQKKSFNELMVSLVLALILVYMVLACQYESLINPLVVMVSVPFAAVGVLITLFLTETTLNLQSYIGCIMLGGIVVNNAILLVDQANRLVQKGSLVRDAVAEAGRRRLRPILMTTLTTILALVPLAMGMGEGAQAQAPLARAVIGGLTGSTLITLVLIPAVYSLFHPQEVINDK
ncbi:MAG: efflux RND transporter permease subunit [Desulfobacula sp.]|mgnify:FL=1|jgi:hydrophobic/amphiphilic exporter-1 (mainly G- bacteria), HAE1 family|uniref:efflux RND transporter permease subunit n=1 Tax=Desulfobacula sp. TaxID=2593537 RepID=UPI001DD6D1B8|nr:efflux RND transporter permease subunit [Desulfobacula sp.]MBT3483909.1 efflux RND transporter permease subunit [Desulfobacula sp.]MBT3803904.1 efflux RND transporter permease subunit [Desulfobacula sp.]MBT4023849.1 efflux RND transporter permease subunit [Desulfobacula sp.]MBT4197591.1 efflux RND transporter permease subunit [Desulfobacula sp.]